MLITEAVVSIGEMNYEKRTPSQVRGLLVLGPLYSFWTYIALSHVMQSSGKQLLPPVHWQPMITSSSIGRAGKCSRLSRRHEHQWRRLALRYNCSASLVMNGEASPACRLLNRDGGLHHPEWWS